MSSRFVNCLFLLILLPVSGCYTLMDDSAVGERRAEVESLKAETRRLRDQVSEMRESLTRLEEEARMQQSSRTAEVKDIKARLEELDRTVRSSEASRGQIKQEIMEDLSKKLEKISEMMGSSRPSVGKVSSPRTVPKKGGAVERGVEHTVKQGETLSEIATAYGVTPSVIIKANDLAKPDSLKVGQKLFIPE
jgi:LysM repeat protein